MDMEEKDPEEGIPTSPIEELINRVNDPDNVLSSTEKSGIRGLTHSVDNVVKASLINLLMGRFSNISLYDKASNEVLKMLTSRADTMDNNELLNFLNILTRTNSLEAKNLMDVFKKDNTDMKTLLKEMEKITKNSTTINITAEKVEAKVELSPDKKERVIKMFQKLSRKDE
jgi:hypothetical protein